MNILSLFDGMSCGRIALERANIKVGNYYASEIDKHAIKVSEANYPDIIRLGDVTKWKEWSLPKIDLLLGGFPCQSYSVAGKRKGLGDTRGSLIFRVFDILKSTKPSDFLLENVKGLLSIEKGEVFKLILSELNKCGYAVDFRLINSNLVSAQNRNRLYIIGKRLDLCKGLEYSVDLNKAIIHATCKKSAHT